MNSPSDSSCITISGGTCGDSNACLKQLARSARFAGFSSFHMEVNAALYSSLANGLIACASAWQERSDGSGDSRII